MSNARFRSWCVTDFILDIEFWKKFYIENKLTYLILGEEICPKSNNKHFQGWFHKTNGSTFVSIQKQLNPRHIEIMKGTPEQNEKYCKKDGKILLNLGQVPEPGHRTDMDDLKDMIKDKMSEIEIFEAQPGNFIRYNKGISKALSLYEEKRNWQMDVRIYFGAPGSGKTRSVYDEFGIENVYEKMPGKWWDGYKGEQVVLIDDFDPENTFNIVFDMWLKLLDRYPYRIEFKGGSTQFRSKVIIITSNFDPKYWFTTRSNIGALFRRITTIKEFN